MGAVLAPFMRITHERIAAVGTCLFNAGLPVHLRAMLIPPFEPATVGTEALSLVPRLLLNRLVALHTLVGVSFLTKRLQGFHTVSQAEGFDGVNRKVEVFRDFCVGLAAFP